MSSAVPSWLFWTVKFNFSWDNHRIQVQTTSMAMVLNFYNGMATGSTRHLKMTFGWPFNKYIEERYFLIHKFILYETLCLFWIFRESPLLTLSSLSIWPAGLFQSSSSKCMDRLEMDFDWWKVHSSSFRFSRRYDGYLNNEHWIFSKDFVFWNLIFAACQFIVRGRVIINCITSPRHNKWHMSLFWDTLYI